MTDTYEIFPWNANFETGIPSIDSQHRRLVELINTLAMHLAYQPESLTLDAVLRELGAYVEYHFDTEEQLMHRYLGGDALQTEHEDSHRAFAQKLDRFRQDFDNKSTHALCTEILTYLSHWLALHILDADKRVAKVILAMQAGASLDEAKVKSGQEMSGLMNVLVDTILSMYDTLSSRTLLLMREVHERKRAEEKLRLAASVYENTLEAVFIANADRKILEVNRAFGQSIDHAVDTLAGMDIQSLKSGLQGEHAEQIWKMVEEQDHWRGEIRSRNRDGELVPEWLTLSAIRNSDGDIVNYVGLFTNVSQLVERQHELEFYAYHDVLTRLPNRLLFADRLEQAVAKAKRDHRYCAICYLDLDDFKGVNDAYGHGVGDELLRQLAARVRYILRANDTFARLGGDEFVLLMDALIRPEDSHTFLKRIMDEIERPFDIGGHRIHVTASIGVDFFPTGAREGNDLLKQADQALYRAKHTGKSCYTFFEAEDTDTEALPSPKR